MNHIARFGHWVYDFDTGKLSTTLNQEPMILGDDDMNHLKFNTDDDDETISIMGPPGGPYTLSVDREDLIVAEEEVGEKKDITLGSSADIPWLEVWINNTDGGRRRRKTKKSKRRARKTRRRYK